MITPFTPPVSRSIRPPGALVIEIEGVTKLYQMGEETIHALRGVALTIRRNEYLAIMGPSGSGKSTLMNMLGCLDTPTAGRYEFSGKKVAMMVDDELADIRNREIGFVFQTFNLLPRSDALHNVELPLIYAGLGKDERMERAHQALEDVGLGDRVHHRPNELSGGQRQRVGIARALAGNPPVLLADEPTAALDAFQGRRVMDLLRARAKEEGTTVLVVTHDPRVREFADRVIEMEDGKLKRIVRRLRSRSEPTAEWVFMISNSSSVKRPGLFRIVSEIAIFPRSWKTPPSSRMRRSSSASLRTFPTRTA